MILVSPSVVDMPMAVGDEMLKGIERAGRVCYKSEVAITDESASKFVRMIVKNNHTAMLEHGYIVIRYGKCGHPNKVLSDSIASNVVRALVESNIFLRLEIAETVDIVLEQPMCQFVLGGNARTWLDAFDTILVTSYEIGVYNELMKIINAFANRYPEIYNNPKLAEIMSKCGITEMSTEYVVNFLDERGIGLLPADIVEKFVYKTYRFVMDRGIAFDYVRHRVLVETEVDGFPVDGYFGRVSSYSGNHVISALSPAQESTRWINYLKKDKDSKGLVYVIPPQYAGVMAELGIVSGTSIVDENAYVDDNGIVFSGDMNYDQFSQIVHDYVVDNTFVDDDPKALILKRFLAWLGLQIASEQSYMHQMSMGAAPQEARLVLTNSLKTELVLSGHINQFEEFVRLRAANDAGPQSNELAIPLKGMLMELRRAYPQKQGSYLLGGEPPKSDKSQPSK